MTINFELLKDSKMVSLKIYISPVTEMIEASNLDANEPHSKGSIGNPASVGSDIITNNHMTLTNLFISSYRGATVIKFGQ